MNRRRSTEGTTIAPFVDKGKGAGFGSRFCCLRGFLWRPRFITAFSGDKGEGFTWIGSSFLCSWRHSCWGIMGRTPSSFQDNKVEATVGRCSSSCFNISPSTWGEHSSKIDLHNQEISFQPSTFWWLQSFFRAARPSWAWWMPHTR